MTSRGFGTSLDLAKESAQLQLFNTILTPNLTNEIEDSKSKIFRKDLNNDTVLFGNQTVDIWKDAQTNNVYVLTVLSRKRIILNLHNEIRRLDNLTNDSIATAGKIQDKLTKLAQAYLALYAQRRRVTIGQALIQFDKTITIPRTVWQIAKLEQDLAKLKTRIRIQTQIIYDPTGSIKSALASYLSAYGKAHDNSSSDYIMEIRLTLNNSTQQNSIFSQSGNLTIKLLVKNTILGEKSWPLTASADSKHTVLSQIHSKIMDIVKTDIEPSFLGFVYK